MDRWKGQKVACSLEKKSMYIVKTFRSPLKINQSSPTMYNIDDTGKICYNAIFTAVGNILHVFLSGV